MTGPLIAPSILSADFGHLARDVGRIDEGGADWIHVDVMDGRFVPNITIGPPVVKAVRAVTKKIVDVHLMIVEPERWVTPFADAGADVLTVHAEACVHLHRVIQQIKAAGMKAGVSLNPATSEDVLRYVAGDLDLVLVMSVNPGFGGQSFIHEVLPKIERVRRMLDAAGNQSAHVEVDGGVSPANAGEVCQAGADVLVAGSAVFKHDDVGAAIAAIRAAGGQGR